MSLQEIKNLKKQEKGFTIVELLIVIVVIGILAAIVIVAFNGVQQRARDTQAQTDASTIVKKAEAYNADTGGYPTAVGNFAGDIAALPSGITAVFLTGATSTVTTGTATSSAVAPTGTTTSALHVHSTSGLKTYTVKSCGATTGLTVMYPEGTTVKKISAGTGC